MPHYKRVYILAIIIFVFTLSLRKCINSRVYIVCIIMVFIRLKKIKFQDNLEKSERKSWELC